MPKERGIPLIGRNGLLAVLGCVVGVFVHAIGYRSVRSIPTMDQRLYRNFCVWDLISLIIPLVLSMVLRRGRAFFIGWFVGVLGFELAENVAFPTSEVLP